MYVWKIARVSWLFTILAINIDSAVSSGENLNSEYHTVIHSQGDPCNEIEHCLTLSQFVNNISDYLSENMTLNFLPGEHNLDSAQLIKNINSFYMSSLDTNVTIACSHSGNFEFGNISTIHIRGLIFIGCSGKLINISQLTLKDSQLIGNDIGGTALQLIETSAKLIRTKLINNHGNIVTSLLCENGNDSNAGGDSLYYDVYNQNEDIEISATAGGAIVSTHSNVTITLYLYKYIPTMVASSQFKTVHLNTTQHIGLEVS